MTADWLRKLADDAAAPPRFAGRSRQAIVADTWISDHRLDLARLCADMAAQQQGLMEWWDDWAMGASNEDDLVEHLNKMPALLARLEALQPKETA